MIVIFSNSESSGDDSGDLLIREWLNRSRSRHQISSIASNLSNDSQDSNAEHDNEYREGEFNTEPKISFTQSTHFEAEPQRGPEADSRFRSQAEASTSAQSGHSGAPFEDKEVAGLYERSQFVPMPTSSVETPGSTKFLTVSTISQPTLLLAKWLATGLGTRESIIPRTSLSP